LHAHCSPQHGTATMNHPVYHTRKYFLFFYMALAFFLMACDSGDHDHGSTTVTPNNDTTRTVASLKVVFDTNENELITGSTKKFEVLAIYDDGSEENITDKVTWQSADEDILSIDTDGNATAKSWVATTQLTASFQAETTAIAIQVIPAADASLTSITIDPPGDIELIASKTQTIRVIATYDDGSQQDVTNQATWDSTEEETVATVSPDGTIAASTLIGSNPINVTYQGLNTSLQTRVIPASDAVISKLVIAPEQLTIAQNESHPITIKAIYSDGSEEWVTEKAIWSVSDEMLARIDSGLVQGILVGEVVLSATYETHEITANLTITPSITVLPNLVKLSIQPDAATLSTETQSFQVTAHFDDDSTTDITTQVTWQSSAPDVVSIANGIATPGNQAGTSIITASYENQTVIANITVTLPVTLSNITLSPASASLLNNATQQFVVNGHYSDGSSKTLSEAMSWLSSDNNIATISNGTLTPGSQTGTVTITAEYKNLTAQAEITITAATTLVDITLSPTEANIQSNASQLFSVTGNYSDGTNQILTQNVIWTSSNQTIARINNGIAIAGNTTGSTVITATFEAHSANTTLQVGTAATLQSIELQPNTVSISTTETQQYQLIAHYSDGTNQTIESDITWSSNAINIASIDNGLATPGDSAGQTLISAEYRGFSAQAMLTITASAAILDSIEINPKTAEIHQAESQLFSLTAHYSDGSTQVIDENISWSSSDPTIASMNNGLATAIADTGNVSIEASYDGKQSSANLTITMPKLVNQGSITNPAKLPFSPQAHIHQIVPGSSYYQMNVVKNVTYDLIISHAANRINDFSLSVFDDANFTNLICSAQSDNTTELRCTLTPENTTLYLNVTYAGNNEVEDFSIRADAYEGKPEAPADVGQLPALHISQIGFSESFYQLSILPDRAYRIRITGYRLTATMDVYQNADFSNPLCTATLECQITSENTAGLNQLYLKVDGRQTADGALYAVAATFAIDGGLAGDGRPDEAKDLGEAPLSTFGQVDGTASFYWVSAIKDQVYNVRISGYQQVLTLWINSNFQCAGRGEASQTINCLVMPNIDGFAMSIDGKETGGGTTYNIEVSEVSDPIYYVKTRSNGAGRAAYTFIQVYTLDGELFYQRAISDKPYSQVAFPLASSQSVNIRITNPFQESGNNGYSIRVDDDTDGFATDLIPTDPDAFEPDDDNPTGATELTLGNRSDHTLSTNERRFGDEDWFIFTAP